MKLGFWRKIIVQKKINGNSRKCNTSILGNDVQLYMPLEGLINLDEEKARREKEKTKIRI